MMKFLSFGSKANGPRVPRTLLILSALICFVLLVLLVVVNMPLRRNTAGVSPPCARSRRLASKEEPHMEKESKVFLLDELRKYDGSNSSGSYVAHEGKVYDVSGSKFLFA